MYSIYKCIFEMQKDTQKKFQKYTYILFVYIITQDTYNIYVVAFISYPHAIAAIQTCSGTTPIFCIHCERLRREGRNCSHPPTPVFIFLLKNMYHATLGSQKTILNSQFRKYIFTNGIHHQGSMPKSCAWAEWWWYKYLINAPSYPKFTLQSSSSDCNGSRGWV